jgi:hypothetical protein
MLRQLGRIVRLRVLRLGERDLEACAFLFEWATICEEAGPWAYAASIHAPVDSDLRQIAYLAVWHDIAGHALADDEDFVDEAVAFAVAGFDRYLLAHPEAVRP